MLKAKVELVRVRILDMRIIVPVHAAGEEGCRCRQTGVNAACRERIAVSRRRGTVRSGGTARHVEVVGDQLANTRPVAFDVLGHLADSGPIVINNSRSTPHNRTISEAIGEPQVRTQIGVSVVGDAATRVNYDVRRQGSRRQAWLSSRIAGHGIAVGI